MKLRRADLIYACGVLAVSGVVISLVNPARSRRQQIFRVSVIAAAVGAVLALKLTAPKQAPRA